MRLLVTRPQPDAGRQAETLAARGHEAVPAPLLLRALEDQAAPVRAAAVRLAEQWLGDESHPVTQAALKHVGDADWGVRRQLAASLGAAIIPLLEKYGDDPITVDAALSGLRGRELSVLERLMRDGSAQTPQLDEV